MITFEARFINITIKGEVGDEEVLEEEIAVDEVDEFDESRDEEVDQSPIYNTSTIQGETGQIGSDTSFLLGARTRFGRVVRFNNRLLY